MSGPGTPDSRLAHILHNRDVQSRARLRNRQMNLTTFMRGRTDRRPTQVGNALNARRRAPSAAPPPPQTLPPISEEFAEYIMDVEG